MENFEVNIKERSDDEADYIRPDYVTNPEPDPEAEEGSSESEEESSDSEDEVEDEDAALLTPAIDSQILRTIAAIQTKNAKVYDGNTKFFSEEEMKKAEKEWRAKQAAEKKKDKKYTLRDYERDMVLKHGGSTEDQVPAENFKTHQQEQDEIKQSFKLAAGLEEDNEDEDQEDEPLFTKKTKTKDELEKEEKEYREFLLSNIASDEMTASAFKNWQDYKNNNSVSKEDSFLIDYVLNRGWVDKGESTPSYDDTLMGEGADQEQDEQYLDEVDRFESKYNFRFEEEGSAQIITHARDVEGSVRRKTKKRQRERERKRLKKEAEKKQKEEELARMRNKRVAEITQRLKEIQEITGNDTVGFDKIDFSAIPTDDASEEPKAKKAKKSHPDISGMFDDTYFAEDETDTPEEKEMKRRAKIELEELLDEYHSLGFEDIIGGDLPTRFKYRKTEPENYGLTAEEILLADDAELNKYIGLKALAPYRNDTKKKADMRYFKQRQRVKKGQLFRHLQEKGYKRHKKRRHDGSHSGKDQNESEHNEKDHSEKEHSEKV